MDYLNTLNSIQRQAVESPGGPLLIVAGAGSGKTRVLTYRIAYLIKQGVSPHEIFAVTFTNKASEEMRRRVVDIVGQDLYWVGTFHSICVKLLRRHAAEIGYLTTFSIYDSDDQTSLVKECLKELKLDPKDHKPPPIVNAISRAKDSLVSVEKFAEDAAGHFNEIVAKIYALYEKKLKLYHAFDFGDLISKTIYLFEQKPEILQEYQEKFKHVLVDEYQDTNRAQYQLVTMLSKKHNNIYLVGDPDQSIYRWRGADIRNILNFERDFEFPTLLKMEQNYRSTKTIIEASNELIEHNSQRKDKKLWTDKEEGDKITYYVGDDEQSEARFLTERIEDLTRSENRSLKEMVVFYRVHAQSRVIENGLRRARVPYKIIGGLSFYARKEIKDVMGYLKLILDSHDNISLKRIINVPPRGIGATSLKNLEERAVRDGVTLYETIKQAAKDPFTQNRLRNALIIFVNIIESLRQKVADLTVTQILLETLKSTGYVEMLEAAEDQESEMRLENVRELISATEEFEEGEEDPSLAHFIQLMMLQSQADQYQEGQDQLTLMTLHCAKGLEFPIVFMVGMEEELLPHSISSFDEHELEEERRLCYVGMTRAEEKLFLTGVHERRLYGERKQSMPSRFISEIPKRYIKAIGFTYGTSFLDDTPDYTSDSYHSQVVVEAAPVTIQFEEGDKVSHPEFGIGRIEEILGEENLLKYSVLFNGEEDSKILSAKYAKLSKC